MEGKKERNSKIKKEDKFTFQKPQVRYVTIWFFYYSYTVHIIMRIVPIVIYTFILHRSYQKK